MSGTLIRQTEMENFGMQTAISTKDNGPMIKRMGTALILTRTELSMRVTGLTICRMDRVLRLGLTAANMKASTKKA